jgi:hypothetical protein
MHSLSGLVVGSVWVVCGLVGSICTALILDTFTGCIKQLVVPQTNTAITNVIPLSFLLYNRSKSNVSHISHRTYKYKNELYKYIINKILEDS